VDLAEWFELLPIPKDTPKPEAKEPVRKPKEERQLNLLEGETQNDT
jgi:hypothetical protein